MSRVVDERASQSTRIEVIDLQLVVEVQSRKLREPKTQVPTRELIGELQIGVLWRERVDHRHQVDEALQNRRLRCAAPALLRQYGDAKLEARPWLQAHLPPRELCMRRVLRSPEIREE